MMMSTVKLAAQGMKLKQEAEASGADMQVGRLEWNAELSNRRQKKDDETIARFELLERNMRDETRGVATEEKATKGGVGDAGVPSPSAVAQCQQEPWWRLHCSRAYLTHPVELKAVRSGALWCAASLYSVRSSSGGRSQRV